jgi:16S rRNA (cytidine1402-2'-O)-methyltransferase
MLYIVATPIGNAEDITLRALRALKEADFILAEDTRKTGIFLKRLGIQKSLVSFFEHNERARTPGVLDQLRQGKTIALVSSAGTPTISDPGYRLVRACRKEQLEVTALPGASSIINALVLSSLPHDAFWFLGYIPRKKGARRKLFEKIKGADAAVVLYESPFRMVSSLQELRQVCGRRDIVVAREMTKKFEEIIEGSADDILDHFSKHAPRGEVTLIVGPAS